MDKETIQSIKDQISRDYDHDMNLMNNEGPLPPPSGFRIYGRPQEYVKELSLAFPLKGSSNDQEFLKQVGVVINYNGSCVWVY